MGSSAILSASQQPPGPRGLPTDKLEDLAKRASADNLIEVRELVDELTNLTLFANCASSIKERIVAADLEYRLGEHPGVPEHTLVSVINSFAARFGAPGYARTSRDQIRLFRERVRQHVPHLGAEKGTPLSTQKDMSPAEAAYLAAALATQKVINPRYRVTPEDWVAKFRTPEATPREPGSGRARVEAHKMSDGTDRLLWALEHGLPDESSALTAGIHQFLADLLGR